ncbi:dUTP diphosphatase [bacterium]|nr:dUTP diphosphatase [bacterium]
MSDTRLIIERLNPAAIPPRKAHPSDACFDLFAPEAYQVLPGQRVALGTGWLMQIEEGWEVQIRGRSGLGKRGIEVHFGTIDHLYRQEVKVLVHNASGQLWEVAAGDRVAQMKLARVWEVEIVEGRVEPTQRGGLGSTGR